LRIPALIAVIVTGSLLLLAMRDIPNWGSPNSPASTNPLSQHYIEESYEETHVPNIVTAVLADYRGYDTMFETAVILTAGIAILAILRVYPVHANVAKRTAELKENVKPDAPDIVLETACRVLTPVIQLFALYVVAHGHISPGGGFQGGVIFGASFILIAIAYDLPTALKYLPERRALVLAGTGVLIYAGIGILCMLLGGNFLDYSVLDKLVPVLLDKLVPVLAVKDRYYGILGVEIGVALTVSTVMFLIFAGLSSKGEMEDGL
jgi:multicomponent Na+:H+ antiporter subunit B